MAKYRDLEYEAKFRKYLFSFDYETHKAIVKNLHISEKTIKDVRVGSYTRRN